MRTINYNFFHWGPFLYKTKISEEEVNKLLLLSEKHRGREKCTQDLAGHLKDEYDLPPEEVMPVLKPYYESYMKAAYEQFKIKFKGSITMKSSWVNFMKKGEFNPPHIHPSCNISCVLYLKIPKNMGDYHETSSFPPGSIHFLHGEEGLVNIHDHVFLPETGDFFIFPGDLKHMVYPFQCDGERISLSANLIERTKNEKNTMEERLLSREGH